MSNVTAPYSVGDTHISSTSVCRSLRISGLDRGSTLALTNQIMKWVRNSGEEWTVDRLKTIKTYYLQTLASGSGNLDWVSRNRDGYPKYFSQVFRLKKPQKVLSALMCYTTYVAQKPTKKQIEKFVSSVTAESTFISNFLLSHLSNPRGKPLMQQPQFFQSKDMKNLPSHWAWYGWWRPEQQALRNIRVPQAVGKYDPTSGYYIPEFKSVPMSVETQASIQGYHPALRRWLAKQSNPGALAEVWTLQEINRMVGPVPYQDTHERRTGSFPVGTIGFIQEPGYKLRAVANPLPTLQLALSRLGRRLKEELQEIPEDCTFNQDQGIRDVQQKLREGMELSSIDLSDATNLFPYTLTREVVSRVPNVLKEDLELWDETVKGTWLMPDRSEIRWTRGQPLGVYPSFFGFALSHHALVKSITPEFYRILGDDIVIDRKSGDRLKDLYREIGCKISEPKTINSSLMAEFAGKIILPDRILIQPKFRSPSDRNFIDYVQNLGPRALGFLRPRQRKVLKPFLEMPRSLHPYACGFNPKGKTYEQRKAEAQPILDRLRKEETCEVFYTQLGEELARLSWSIQLRQKRPEIAQGLGYTLPNECLPVSDPSEGNSKQDRAALLRLKVPQDISHLSKDELVWFVKSAEKIDGRMPIYQWPTESNKLKALRSNLLSRIHFISGNTRLELSEPIPDLATRPVGLEPSDPRGNTVLLVLERKLKRSLAREEEEMNQSRKSGHSFSQQRKRDTVSPHRPGISRSR